MRLLHQLPPNTYDDDLALTPRAGPEAVLGLVADVIESALAVHLYLLHPTDVDLSGSRACLAPKTIQPERSVSIAPEVHADGPVPATLSYGVAVIAALATLGTVEMAPEDAEAHATWVAAVRGRLAATWARLPGADVAVELLARCMAFSPSARPHPMNLLEEIAQIRATLARPPDIEAVLVPPVPGLPTPAPSARVGASGAAPLGVPLSHPLVPYAMVAVVLAGLALVVALCTFGVVMGQFSELFGQTPTPTALSPLPSPNADPREAPVAPASLFDRFESAPLAPPVTSAAGGGGEASARPAPAAAAPTTNPMEPATTEPSPERSVPSRTRTARPKAAPGSDLRDPWGR